MVDNNVRFNFEISGAELVKQGITSIQKVMVDTTNTMKQITTSSRSIKDGFANVSKSVKILHGNFVEFRGELLTFLFAGMSIDRVFTRIQRSAVKMFQEVIATSSGAISNISMLSANFDYLRFTIGNAINQALGPLMPYIIDLIRFFAELIERNPGKVFWGIIAAITAGKLLSLLGQVGLFINGIAMLGAKMGTTGLLEFFGNLGSVVLSSGAALLALFAVLWLVWQNDIGNIKEGVTTLFRDLVTDLSDIFGDLTGLVVSVWDILAGIFSGNYDRFKTGLLNFGKSLLLLMVDVSVGITRLLVNLSSMVIKIVADMTTKVFVLIHKGLQDILGLFGIELSNKPAEFMQNFTNGFIEGVEGLRSRISDRFDIVKDMAAEMLPVESYNEQASMMQSSNDSLTNNMAESIPTIDSVKLKYQEMGNTLIGQLVPFQNVNNQVSSLNANVKSSNDNVVSMNETLLQMKSAADGATDSIDRLNIALTGS